MLIVDEVVDGGVVMESDPASLVQRVAVRSEDIPLGEQTVAQASTFRDFPLICRSFLMSPLVRKTRPR